MNTSPTVTVLRRLARGEILEQQAGTYWVRGERISARLARKLIRLEFVELPPNLFTSTTGRITDAGYAELQTLENLNDRK